MFTSPAHFLHHSNLTYLLFTLPALEVQLCKSLSKLTLSLSLLLSPVTSIMVTLQEDLIQSALQFLKILTKLKMQLHVEVTEVFLPL